MRLYCGFILLAYVRVFVLFPMRVLFYLILFSMDFWNILGWMDGWIDGWITRFQPHLLTYLDETIVWQESIQRRFDVECRTRRRSLRSERLTSTPTSCQSASITPLNSATRARVTPTRPAFIVCYAQPCCLLLGILRHQSRVIINIAHAQSLRTTNFRSPLNDATSCSVLLSLRCLELPNSRLLWLPHSAWSESVPHKTTSCFVDNKHCKSKF